MPMIASMRCAMAAGLPGAYGTCTNNESQLQKQHGTSSSLTVMRAARAGPCSSYIYHVTYCWHPPPDVTDLHVTATEQLETPPCNFLPGLALSLWPRNDAHQGAEVHGLQGFEHALRRRAQNVAHLRQLLREFRLPCAWTRCHICHPLRHGVPLGAGDERVARTTIGLLCCRRQSREATTGQLITLTSAGGTYAAGT